MTMWIEVSTNCDLQFTIEGQPYGGSNHKFVIRNSKILNP